MPQPRIESKMAAPWWQLSWRERVLGAAMLPMFGTQNRLPVPIAIFPEYVCGQLGVQTDDRASVRQSLRRIYLAKLIVEEREFLRLLYGQRSLERYRGSSGDPLGTQGNPYSPDSNQASGITQLRSASGEPKGTQREPRWQVDPTLKRTLLKGIQAACGEWGIEPAPRCKPWEYEGGVERMQELVSSGRCATADEAAYLLARTALRHKTEQISLGVALLEAPLPPVLRAVPSPELLP